MIVSVHLADVGPLRAPRLLLGRPDTAATPGLTYAEPVLTAPLGGGLLPRPRLGTEPLRAHQAAVKADRVRPFHHESAFVRFRPYASQGEWDGRDPLATI